MGCELPIGMLAMYVRFSKDEPSELFGFWYFKEMGLPSSVVEKQAFFMDLMAERCCQVSLKGSLDQIGEIIGVSEQEQSRIPPYPELIAAVDQYGTIRVAFDDLSAPAGTSLGVDVLVKVKESQDTVIRELKNGNSVVNLEIDPEWSLLNRIFGADGDSLHDSDLAEEDETFFDDSSHDDIDAKFDPHYISLELKSWGHIHRDDPSDYVSTVKIDILYAEEQKKIGEGQVIQVRMDQFLSDDNFSLFDVFDCYSQELHELYGELFIDDELRPSLEDELCDMGNIVLIESIALKPEYRGKGLGGILALAIAERFGGQDLVALKPWPMNSSDPEDGEQKWGMKPLTKTQEKLVAKKLRKSYMSAGFKPLFRGSEHLFLTHYRIPTATQLIDGRDS